MNSLSLLRSTNVPYFKLKKNPLLSTSLFCPHIPLSFFSGKYHVFTTRSPNVIRKLGKFRHEVFYRDKKIVKNCSILRSLLSFSHYDLDSFDFTSDHLVVEDESTKLIVATYRLRTSVHHKSFYTQTEFHIPNFTKLKEEGLCELGRAAVHTDYRQGHVLLLLWRGLSEYLKKSQLRYAIGLSSFPGNTSLMDSSIQYLNKEKATLPQHYEVKRKFKERPKKISDAQDKIDILPPLVSLYLKAGAKFSQTAAYDQDMQCFDLFTLLDLKNLNSLFSQKFFADSPYYLNNKDVNGK